MEASRRSKAWHEYVSIAARLGQEHGCPLHHAPPPHDPFHGGGCQAPVMERGCCDSPVFEREGSRLNREYPQRPGHEGRGYLGTSSQRHSISTRSSCRAIPLPTGVTRDLVTYYAFSPRHERYEIVLRESCSACLLQAVAGVSLRRSPPHRECGLGHLQARDACMPPARVTRPTIATPERSCVRAGSLSCTLLLSPIMDDELLLLRLRV